MSAAVEPLVKVRGLTKHFPVTRGAVFVRDAGSVRAVDDVTLDVRPGETLSIVGESGCGKSTMARLILRLLEPTSGSVVFDGVDITKLSEKELRPMRREMQMVFQDPYGSLNPRHTIGQIIGAAYRAQKLRQPGQRDVQELLELVGLSAEHYNRYPSQFSGGQRQRVGIARAIALRPKLLVCDEPVSGLDVSIQAQILNLIRSLQEELKISVIFISHDLGVVSRISDRIAVMYLGRVVELADAEELWRNPKHPYTAALFSAIPKGYRPGASGVQPLALDGDPPSPAHPPSGCFFHPRCAQARRVGTNGDVPEECRTVHPALDTLAPAHLCACWHPVDARRPQDTRLPHEVTT